MQNLTHTLLSDADGSTVNGVVHSCVMNVADLTVEEFKALLFEVVQEAVEEYLDPDYGLTMKESVRLRLEESLRCPGELIPADRVFGA